MKAIITVVSDKENYTFVVKDSLCFAEGIQGMSRRNLLYNWSAYIKKKEKISEETRFVYVPIKIPQN